MHYSITVKEIQAYMKDHLTEDLSLEVLAQRAHFSTYYFHRLFALCTGEAPMESVRRNRLRAAARDLSASSMALIEIAAKYRFESQDGFCRAFKKYYGITPGEYRRRHGQPLLARTAQQKEAMRMKYDLDIYSMMTCSVDEKREVIHTIDRLLELSQRAQNYGVFALEEEIKEEDPKLLAKALQMLTDGIEEETLREILLNYILCSGFRGKELLHRILIIEGVTAIQQGMSPELIRERLFSYFGEDFIEELKLYYKLDDKSQQERLHIYMQGLRDKTASSKNTLQLEEPLLRMDSRSLQRLLREADPVRLAMAMVGSSGQLQVRILENMTNRTALKLIQMVEAMEPLSGIEIGAAQKGILEVLHTLVRQGDIRI